MLLILLILPLALGGCAIDPRDGHLEEITKAALQAKETGAIVYITRAVKANQPFQPEDLKSDRIPKNMVAQDDVTKTSLVEGRFARSDLPQNHIVHQHDLLPQPGLTLKNWHQVYKANVDIPANEIISRENSIYRLEPGMGEDYVYMHKTKHPIAAGQSIEPKDVYDKRMVWVFYPKRKLKKGEVFDEKTLGRVMMSQDMDGRYAAIEPTERLKALRDIKQGEHLTDDDVEMFGEPDTATYPAK